MMQSKTCTMCKCDKSVVDFGKDYRLKTGLRSRCKSCERIANKKNRERHTRVTYDSKHYETNTRECSECKESKLLTEFPKNRNMPMGVGYLCRSCNSRRQKVSYRKLKHEILEAYGRECACCGETTFEFLTLEHKDGHNTPNRERKVTGGSQYKELKRQGFPNDGSLEILCWNCNCSKGVYGMCPHNEELK